MERQGREHEKEQEKEKESEGWWRVQPRLMEARGTLKSAAEEAHTAALCSAVSSEEQRL